MMDEAILKNYGAALADVLTDYAKELAKGDTVKAFENIEKIGSGDMRVVIVSQLVPFTVHAVHLDAQGNQKELFTITDGDLH